MSKVVDYYLTLVSPWCYLAGPRLIALAQKHGAAVRVKPVDFGRVLSAGGGLPLAQRPKQRQAYRLVELARWRDHLGMPLNLHPAAFPAPTELASGMVLAANGAGADALHLTQAILAAVWAQERNIADPATLRAIAEECGMNGSELLEQAKAAAISAELHALTDEAIAQGVFGAPTFIYEDEMFWGQDRLDFLDRALGARPGA